MPAVYLIKKGKMFYLKAAKGLKPTDKLKIFLEKQTRNLNPFIFIITVISQIKKKYERTKGQNENRHGIHLDLKEI